MYILKTIALNMVLFSTLAFLYDDIFPFSSRFSRVNDGNTNEYDTRIIITSIRSKVVQLYMKNFFFASCVLDVFGINVFA